MKIDLHNYEAFFLDYHEGTLSPRQVAELMLFVEQHPHLKAELESFESISLNDFEDDTIFAGKDKLKKAVTADNFEEMAIAFVEGTLPVEMQEGLLAFVEKNPSYKVQLELFRSTVLPADQITFEGKEKLKKKIALPAETELSETAFLFISAVEGTLDAGQQEQLDLLLQQEQHKKEFALYQSVKLPADRIVFADKASLKRKDRARVPFYYYIAAAASAALLIGFYFFPGNGNGLKQGNTFSFNRPSPYHDVSPLPKENDQNTNSNTYVNANGDKKNNNVPVLVKNNDQYKNRDEQPIVKEEKKNPGNQPAPDSSKREVIVKNNSDQFNNIELVNIFNDPEENPVNTNKNEEYFTLRQAVSYKVKNALLKNEMSDTSSYRDDKKRFTWYDAVLVLVKGVRNLTGRDVEVKKRYNTNNELIAYEFQAGKYTYTRPVSRND
jgi:hypothetical protein